MSWNTDTATVNWFSRSLMTKRSVFFPSLDRYSNFYVDWICMYVCIWFCLYILFLATTSAKLALFLYILFIQTVVSPIIRLKEKIQYTLNDNAWPHQFIWVVQKFSKLSIFSDIHRIPWTRAIFLFRLDHSLVKKCLMLFIETRAPIHLINILVSIIVSPEYDPMCVEVLKYKLTKIDHNGKHDSCRWSQIIDRRLHIKEYIQYTL